MASFMYGDTDANGEITANDAAVVMQKISVDGYEMPIEKMSENWLKYTDVEGYGKIRDNDAKCILRKVLIKDYKFLAE